MVRWVVGSILHGVDPLIYFSFQPVLHDWCNKVRGMCYPVSGMVHVQPVFHDWCNKVRGMCYPVSGMVHIKKPLMLIERCSPCGGSGISLSLSEWSFTIIVCPTP